MASSPPLPDGFVADATAPVGAPQAAAPALPDGFEEDPAPINDNGSQLAFSDELPPQASRQLSPEDTATFYKMLRGDGMPRASADELRRFVGSKGLTLNNAEAIVAARDAGQGVHSSIDYPLPKVENPDGRAGSLARGVVDTLTFGTAPKIGALIAGGESALHGGGFSDAYHSMLDQNEGAVAADSQEHPYYRIAGQLLGGMALPSGLEGVGYRAGASALRAGASMQEARGVAMAAVRNRLAWEGGAYGAAHGAGSGDSLSDATKGAITEGALGASAGAAFGIAGQYIDPVIAVSKISGAADQVYNAGRRLISPFTQEGAQDRAAEILRNSATHPVGDIVSAIEGAPTPIDGVQPTLAEVAGDPGLAGLQRGHANTDVNTAAAVGERNAANALARTRAASGAMGDGLPQAAQDFAVAQMATAERASAEQQAGRQAGIDARLAGRRQAAEQGHAAASAALSQAVEKLGPTADREATGASARDAFDTAYEAAKGRTREAYADPALNKPRPIKIPQDVFLKLRQAADDFYGDGGGEIPTRLQSILSDMADPNATTRTLTNIDRRLADFAGEARMQGRRSESAFAERVRGDLGDFVQKAAPPEYRAAIANAKAIRAEQGRIFETGDAASAFSRDRFGNPSVGDTTVPTRLVRPGALGGDTADGLIQAVGPEHAENIIRQEIRRVAEEKGVQTAAQARALITRYGDAARRFPQVREDLRNLQERAGELDAARGIQSDAATARASAEEVASTKELSALHQQLLISPIAKLADPSVDPASFVRGLMQRSDDGRQFRALATSLRAKTDALAGLRRSLGDYIIEAGAGPNFTASGDRIPAINKTRQAIDTVVKRAGPALTTEQKIVLKTVQRELERANFAVTASKPAGSETAINKTFVDLIRQAPIVPSKVKSLITHVLASLGNGDEVKSLITEAILDPKFAATLLKRPTERHLALVGSAMGKRSEFGGQAIYGLSGVASDAFGLQQHLSQVFSGSPTRAAADQGDQKTQRPSGRGQAAPRP